MEIIKVQPLHRQDGSQQLYRPIWVLTWTT